ncbi:MAG: alkaline phosphatase family protein [Flavobacteriaceae bacterium]|nr:alkaline phosphatase family protein [Flavobacteriaceae bacterium]
MKFRFSLLLLLGILFYSCDQTKEKSASKKTASPNFVLAFGSCNNQNIVNELWSEILKNNPDVFIWGGDIVYSDTYDMALMKKNYEQQKNKPSYQNFTKQVPVLGIWDDHDYGLNDGGMEYDKKDSVQQIFLDFFDLDPTDQRRSRKGIYHAKEFSIDQHSIKIILLDTRYFRTALTIDTTGTKRYVPNRHDKGTMLGTEQWHWLENELKTSKSDFNIIVSSVQFLSDEHGFESWGNMPNEVRKLKNIIGQSKAKGVIILSGDRHIAEISKDTLTNMHDPLIDFTSSGMTHSYSSFEGEKNKYRITNVVSDKNFGILNFDFNSRMVQMQIRGINNKILASHVQKY